jgi:hypothetical protein
MPREKKVQLGAINLTMHPHKPEMYAKLFRQAQKLKCASRIAGDKAGLIASANYINKDDGPSSAMTGDLFRYTNIDLKGDWYNTLTNELAKEDDLAGVSVPEHLKPNSSRFSYIFFPDTHTLFYESYYDGHTLGPTSAQKLISGVFEDPRIQDKYGVIDVTVIPAKEELEKALAIFQLEKLEMTVTRPNPDNHQKAEQRVLRRLNAQNIAKYQHQMSSIPGQSIKPDKDTTTLAKIAAKNGNVTAKGKDQQNHPVNFQTEDHPWVLTDYYDPELESAYETFKNAALDSHAELADWND